MKTGIPMRGNAWRPNFDSVPQPEEPYRRPSGFRGPNPPPPRTAQEQQNLFPEAAPMALEDGAAYDDSAADFGDGASPAVEEEWSGPVEP